MQAGGAALFFEATNRKSTPCWRGPAKISDVDDSGAKAEPQAQAVKVARQCARKKVEGVERNPSPAQAETCYMG